MTRYAVCVGINDYPGSGSDLHGCVNDAVNWSRLLLSKGYGTVTLLDSRATRANILDELRSVYARARFGDRVVFTYSGHGSWIPDFDGDEADARDECLVTYDWERNGYITDDELFVIHGLRRFGVRSTTISDSCHSGTLARMLDMSPGVPRFMPPSILFARELPEQPNRNLRGGTPRPGSILFSGCDDLEYSYDAVIDNKPQGAFSHAALATYREGQSHAKWYAAIRSILPSSDYPQTPQLQCYKWQRYLSL